MALTKKTPPVVKDVYLNRIIKRIYDDINDLINSVNKGALTQSESHTRGKSGDIRVVRDGAGDYFLEAKTNEGWVQSDGTAASGFKFRDK